MAATAVMIVVAITVVFSAAVAAARLSFAFNAYRLIEQALRPVNPPMGERAICLSD